MRFEELILEGDAFLAWGQEERFWRAAAGSCGFRVACGVGELTGWPRITGSRIRAFPVTPVPSIDQATPAGVQPTARSSAVASESALIEPLTRREQEVLELLAQHLNAVEIAQQLVISTSTVKRHRANIYQKLGVNRRRDALAAAQALGILAHE